MKKIMITLIFTSFMGSIACYNGKLEIVGNWNDNFGGEHRISIENWEVRYEMFMSISVNRVVSYDNGNNSLIVQYPADNPFTPNEFAKNVWTEVESDMFYYCSSAMGHDTEGQAWDESDFYDETEPDMGGCGGFSWTKMTKK